METENPLDYSREPLFPAATFIIRLLLAKALSSLKGSYRIFYSLLFREYYMRTLIEIVNRRVHFNILNQGRGVADVRF